MAEIKSVKSAADKAARKQSGKSGTGYPYYGLEDSVDVARAVWNRGGGTCTPDALASFLNYSSTNNGSYLTRISAAKMFGLIEVQRGSISVTERAKAIISPVMPEDEKRAKVEAFLGVPLFKGIFDMFKGKTIPQEMGLRNLLHNHFHIVQDRVAPAYRTLMQSAEYAGFFETSGDKTRLIAPTLNASSAPPPDPGMGDGGGGTPELPTSKGGGSGGNPPPPGIHPAIMGLLREIPAAGSVWPAAKRERFIAAFKSMIDVIYPEEE